MEKGTGQREVRPVWNNTIRINHQNLYNSKRNFAPTAVLTKSRIVPISTARQNSSRAAAPVSAARPINTAAPKPLVNVAKPRQNALHKSHSLSRRPFYQQTALKNRNLNNKINNAKVNSVNTAKRNRVTSVVGKQGINDVKHMTGNISYLTDFKKHDGGYVAFGERAKGGKISGKGTIKTEGRYMFGPTSMSSIMHKKYCLVITDDFSRFTWVFFLATKNETSRILKKFITEIENLVDKKVKIIRCDNGTKFKNSVMNELCEEEGIKREYIMARTPQQNRVAERRNRTLIEAAKTMLADSELPTIFWTEAVNTACYVQNRILVVKPHFKTPYELFRDQLGKFDGKAYEGIFVGYSTISKDFRVYNTRTRKVEENLYITFLENKPMITCGGPEWLFDIDALSKSMNYAPVPAGTKANDFAGKEASFDAESECDNQEMPNAESNTKNVNTAGLSINTANTNDNTGSLNINTVSPPVSTATLTYTDYLSDPLMPDLEDTRIFDDAYDDR
nr:hypothetical protein [Tanacetum cinerariifolium]